MIFRVVQKLKQNVDILIINYKNPFINRIFLFYYYFLISFEFIQPERYDLIIFRQYGYTIYAFMLYMEKVVLYIYR